MSKRHTNPPNLPIAKTSGSKIPARLTTNGYTAIKQCRDGMMIYNINDLFVGRSLDLYGEWCAEELIILDKILRPGDVVIDVGANIGSHTVFFGRKVEPSGVVYAIEPQRLTFEFLCANLAINGLVNTIPLQVGAGEKEEQIMIPVLNPESPQNFAALSIEGHTQGEPVKIITIDSLNLQRCNLIKIDVEGMELQVLSGAVQTIKTCRPFLFVENNTKEGAPQTVQAIFELGYTCWWHIAPYYNPDNFFHNRENIFANFVPESNMICVPQELNLNVTGFEPVVGIEDNWVQAVMRINQRIQENQ